MQTAIKTYAGAGGWTIRKREKFFDVVTPGETRATTVYKLAAARHWCEELTRHIGPVSGASDAEIVKRVQSRADVRGWIRDYRHDYIDGFSVADFAAGRTCTAAELSRARRRGLR